MDDKPYDQKTIISRLRMAHGDLYVASSWLGITKIKLERIIKCDAVLTRIFKEIVGHAVNGDIQKISSEQFAAHIDVLRREYMIEGLNIIRDIAQTEATPDAATLRVKLDAALALAGMHKQAPKEITANTTTINFNQFNEDYQRAMSVTVDNEVVTDEPLQIEQDGSIH